MRKTKAMSANNSIPADDLVRAGVDLFLNGHGNEIVGFMNWFLSNIPQITPYKMIMKTKKNLASIKL